MADHIVVDPEFGAKLIQSPEVLALMTVLGHEVKLVSEATAPVERGDFRSSFRVIIRVKRGGAVVRVFSFDPGGGAAKIELGTKYTPAHRTMTKALAYVARRRT
ncbi:hypothetical protein Lfu02_54960 [Longispora fulva]|uniref:Uncharacterized protein n=1 Tax=Longispora fulva TaxID=619741 RepID=A0A8J7KX89_9ACTN|nr:hypothetical protein [Longispora fulva]MBG6137522.1 hypothetical protein [Longispora fulva]GIG61124.1 hypothetical protein Lfu02_54960 [Longispora fulva]